MPTRRSFLEIAPLGLAVTLTPWRELANAQPQIQSDPTAVYLENNFRRSARDVMANGLSREGFRSTIRDFNTATTYCRLKLDNQIRTAMRDNVTNSQHSAIIHGARQHFDERAPDLLAMGFPRDEINRLRNSITDTDFQNGIAALTAGRAWEVLEFATHALEEAYYHARVNQRISLQFSGSPLVRTVQDKDHCLDLWAGLQTLFTIALEACAVALAVWVLPHLWAICAFLMLAAISLFAYYYYVCVYEQEEQA